MKNGKVWNDIVIHIYQTISYDYLLGQNIISLDYPFKHFSLCRRGSLDRKDKRSSWAASESDLNSTTGGAAQPVAAGLDNFPPVTLTVSSFFKQEADKLKDEDLYKHLQAGCRN